MNEGQQKYQLTSAHFTESFVERLLLVLVVIPSRQAGGMPLDDLPTLMQSRITGSRQAVMLLVSGLSTLRLVSIVDGVIARTTLGDRVRRQMRSDGSYPLAVAIVRSGIMASQIRAIRAVLRKSGEGYVCSRVAAQSVAPQLVGLLARMPEVRIGGRITIGAAAGIELDSMWNELAPEGRIDWQEVEMRRKAIGDRAELYSMQLETSVQVGARENVFWVSRDDDSLGYDIEVRGNPIRRIEVKGSSGPDVKFLLSSNEYRVARTHRDAYEIHFWGKINLRLDPQDDFERLISAGYPIRISDPVAAFSNAPWRIEPSVYRVLMT